MMIRAIVLTPLVAAISAVTPALAQFTPGTGASGPAPGVPSVVMLPGKFFVDMKTAPKPRAGNPNKELFRKTCGPTGPCTDQVADVNDDPRNIGQFRNSCFLSHVSFDDPIVFPGRSGMTHLHAFYGNTSTRATSDLTKFATTGRSTCSGGNTNRTGYWAPTLVHHCPAGSTDGCVPNGKFRRGGALYDYVQASYVAQTGDELSRDGEIVFATFGSFYYKSGNSGVDFANGQWFPPGHRMIIGNPNAAVPQSGSLENGVYNECWVHGSVVSRTKELPTSAEGAAYVAAAKSAHPEYGIPDSSTGCDEINFFMSYPECWDGVNLDAPDHLSHMAQAIIGSPSHCPSTHPVVVPEMTVNLHTAINNADLDYLRLSSDPPKSSGQRAGLTLHTDRVEGFSLNPSWGGFGRTIFDILLVECLGARRSPAIGTDCHVNNLRSPLHDGNQYSLD